MNIDDYVGRWFVNCEVPSIGEIWELYNETKDNPDEYDMNSEQVLDKACELLGMDCGELLFYLGAISLYVSNNGYKSMEGVNRIFNPTFGKEL